MKKVFLALLAFTMMLSFKIDSKADTPSSLSDLIDSYGVAGQREISQYQTNPLKKFGIESSTSKVLTIYNSSNGKLLTVSNDPYVIYNEKYEHQTMNISSSVPFANVNQNFPGLSSIFSDTTGNYYHYLPSGSGSIIVNNADIKYDGSVASFNDWLNNNPSNPNDPNALSGLPVLTYTTSTSTTYKFLGGFDKKAKLSWDFNEKEPYKSQSQNFAVDVTVSGRLNTSGPILTSDMSMDPDHKVILTEGGCNVASNSFTWLYQATGLKYYKTYGLNQFPEHDNNAQGQSEGYRVYVRTRNVKTGEVSAWKIYNFIGGIFSSAGYAQDDSDPENPTIKPLQPSNSDNDDYSVKYDPDSNTDAQADPTGQNYKGNSNYDPTTLFNNLKAAVNSISELPGMFAQVVTFVPEWLISLIFISIGMLVVIGLVKIVLN